MTIDIYAAKGDVLIAVRDSITKGKPGLSGHEIATLLNYGAADAVRVISELHSEGLLKRLHDLYSAPDYTTQTLGPLYAITVTGAQSAAFKQEKGYMPHPISGGLTQNNAVTISGGINQISQGSTGAVSMTMNNGALTPEFQTAIDTFLSEVKKVPDEFARELLETSGRQMVRAVQEEKPVAGVLQRASDLVQSLGGTITNGAVLWTALKGVISLIDPSLAQTMPDALPGLGN